VQLAHDLDAEHRIRCADRHERGAVPLLRPELHGRAALGYTGHRRVGHDELRKRAHAGLVAHVGIRRVVRSNFRVSQMRRTALDQLAYCEIGMRRAVGAPRDESGSRSGTHCEPGIHRDQPREPWTEPGVDRQRQADEPAPILHDERDALELQALDQPQHEVAMKVKAVVRVVHGLVGAAEAVEVGRDDATAARDEHRDHASIQEAPRGLAVQAQNRVLRVARAGIDVRRAQPFVTRQVVDVLRRVRKVGQVRESFFRRAECFDRHGWSLQIFSDAKLTR
jgi:hypothetical protein